MPEPVPGIHHVTALAGEPQRNADFYTQLLGLRLVKRSVNQDSLYTYHLFYGDGKGSPGTTMTFFPWPDGRQGEPGTGQATVVAFAIPEDAAAYWEQRLHAADVEFERGERFDEAVLRFHDPDGLILELVTVPDADARDVAHWDGSPVPAEHAIRGFHGVTITLETTEQTVDVLELMGYEKQGEDGSRVRYEAQGTRASVVDLQCAPNQANGEQGVGTVHHVAFRTEDGPEQEAWQQELRDHGLNVTPVIDRWWFTSIYFREPGGVLFEIATEEPGFTRDEPLESLGEQLVLPAWLAEKRDEIEAHLPPLDPHG